MKKIFILLAVLIIGVSTYAQTPQSFKYQAIIRETNGNPKANQSVLITVSILKNGVAGTLVYSEKFDTITNAYGLVNLNIGKGSVLSGTFAGINWSVGTYFIKLAVDGTEMGTSQLLSVPYALYAEKAGNSFSGNYNDLTNKPDFSKFDNDSTNDITKPAGAENGDLLSYDGNNWVAKRIVLGVMGYTGSNFPFNIRNPYLGLSYEIALVGVFPSRNMGTDEFIGSIGIFAGNFEVKGWAYCNGQILSIAQNSALFSLLGTTYGGNGQTTFALPDLRGRTPIHVGQGLGLSNISLGETGGSETHTLITSELPAHNHTYSISYE